jgi:hypothetical protein
VAAVSHSEKPVTRLNRHQGASEQRRGHSESRDPGEEREEWRTEGRASARHEVVGERLERRASGGGRGRERTKSISEARARQARSVRVGRRGRERRRKGGAHQHTLRCACEQRKSAHQPALRSASEQRREGEGRRGRQREEREGEE